MLTINRNALKGSFLCIVAGDITDITRPIYPYARVFSRMLNSRYGGKTCQVLSLVSELNRGAVYDLAGDSRWLHCT